MVSISFLGAAGGVTGSQYWVRTGKASFLVDCGLFQGSPEEEQRNFAPFPYDPAKLDFVLLTHAHVDHCGALPHIVQSGFRGPVYTTAATHDLCKIVLIDSAHIQEEDFDDCVHQHRGPNGQRNDACDLLYNREDAEKALTLFRDVNYDERIVVADGIRVRFQDAGHILGSASIEVSIDREGDSPLTVLFSGDIGRKDNVIIRSPTPASQADYILMESTYGGQNHQPGREEMLADVVNQTRARGGNLVIPAFSVQRTQELIYVLDELLRQGKIQQQPFYLDSPMAIRVTEVYKDHPECWDAEMRKLVNEGDTPLVYPGMVETLTADQSKEINRAHGAIIMSSNGMLTGGRVLHHLRHNIGEPDSTILFVGYQAENTTGYELEQGAKRIEVDGHTYDVRAQIRDIRGFSAHAGQDELLGWLSPSRPKKVFLVHGEPDGLQALMAAIKQKLDYAIEVPKQGQSFTLE